MGLRRGAVSLLVNELLSEELVFEGMTGEAQRGRKPTLIPKASMNCFGRKTTENALFSSISSIWN